MFARPFKREVEGKCDELESARARLPVQHTAVPPNRRCTASIRHLQLKGGKSDPVPDVTELHQMSRLSSYCTLSKSLHGSRKAPALLDLGIGPANLESAFADFLPAGSEQTRGRRSASRVSTSLPTDAVVLPSHRIAAGHPNRGDGTGTRARGSHDANTFRRHASRCGWKTRRGPEQTPRGGDTRCHCTSTVKKAC